MDLRNCKECNRMFQFVGSPLCSRCVKDRESDYVLVRDFLKENPGSSITVVEEETGVGGDKILQFLREDRLEIKGEDGYILECESCGEKIPSGRMCRACASGLEREISYYVPKKKDKLKKKNDGVKFRIADRTTDRRKR